VVLGDIAFDFCVAGVARMAPILHHLFSLSFFPHAIFTFLLLLVGRS
jgi:hypothetical protein